jgi:hypothetical protein
MKPVKILITIAAWQRRDITRICYEGIKRLMAYNPAKFDIKALVIYSDEADKELAEEYGFKTVYADNKPFGAKLNVGLAASLSMDFDYKLGLGSDDLLDNKILDIYYEYFIKNVGIIGVEDLALVDAPTKAAKIFSYGQMIGAGRAIKKTLLEKAATKYAYLAKKGFVDMRIGKVGKGAVIFLPDNFDNEYLEQKNIIPIIQLWDNDIDCGADSNSAKSLKMFNEDIVRIEAKKPLVVDIKSEVNITAYESLKGPAIDIKELYQDFPELKKL